MKKTTRPQRLQIFVSDQDLETLEQEAQRQHRKASNLAAAIVAQECEKIRKSNNEK